jgi:3-oxoacyl-[acyl-carrier protein] reductase
MSLVGKTVVLTGATAETGAEIGRMLLQNGAATVGLLDWHGLRLDALTDALADEFGEARVVSLPTDLTDRTQVRHSLREFSRIAGGIDLLVENTGALVTRSVGALMARGIIDRPAPSWVRELQHNCTGIQQNLRSAFGELGKCGTINTVQSGFTVTGKSARSPQDLVPN